VSELAYDECAIAAFANIPFRKGVLALRELARKMEGVEARW
jgi:hypothetical protein